MNEMKNAKESINIRMIQAKERMWIRRQDFWNYPVKGSKEKRMEKAYMIYGIPLRETTHKLMESRKKRERGQKAYLNK